MTELELLRSYLNSELTTAENEMIALRTRVELLTKLRGKVEDAINREKQRAAGSAAPQP